MLLHVALIKVCWCFRGGAALKSGSGTCLQCGMGGLYLCVHVAQEAERQVFKPFQHLG